MILKPGEIFISKDKIWVRGFWFDCYESQSTTMDALLWARQRIEEEIEKEKAHPFSLENILAVK